MAERFGLVAAIDLHSGILSVDGDDVWFLFSARAWPDCLQAYEQLARALRLAERLTRLASYERCARYETGGRVCYYLSIYLSVCLSIYLYSLLRTRIMLGARPCPTNPLARRSATPKIRGLLRHIVCRAHVAVMSM